MQCTADFHEQLADARLSEAAGIMDNTAALDATVDMLDAHAPTGEAPIRRFLRACELPSSRLPGWHDDVDRVECERQEAQILEPSTACRQGVWSGVRNPLIVGAAGIGLTQEEDRKGRIDQQDVLDRMALFLAAITARLLNWILGALKAPLGPVVPKRGEAGAEAGAAVGRPDVREDSSVETTSALASTLVTPRRFASSVKDRLGASPSARNVARRTTKST
jgi:hypothetical protein